MAPRDLQCPSRPFAPIYTKRRSAHTGTGTGKNTTNRNRVEPGNLDFVRMQRG